MMDLQLMREEIDRLVNNMLDAIYKENGDPITEINFTINCLEAISSKDFTPEETVKLFSVLAKIVQQGGNI